MKTILHLLTACFLLASASWANAQGHLSAPKLFPSKTLAYVRVDDTRDMKAKMEATGMGKMMNDPQIAPILGTFYSTFVGQLQGMQDIIGLNLDELLSIPNGELAIALVATKTDPAVVLMLEAGDEMPALQVLIERAEQATDAGGGMLSQKEVGKIKLLSMGRSDRESLTYFIDSGVMVASNRADYVEQLAMVWTGNGIDHKPLSDNRDFTTIMSRCVGTEGERPQVSFFVDPLAMVRELGKSTSGSVVVLAGLKSLGVDGIKGIGGSAIIAPNEFDSILHGHVLLNPNRQGIMKVIRPKAGPTEPEPWVSEQVISYFTMNWDMAKTFNAIEGIVDTFAGEGTFNDRFVKEADRNLGINLRSDIIDGLDDRISIVQVIVPPKKINSQSNVYCIHVKNASQMKSEILPKIFEKLKSSGGPAMTTKVFGEATIYTLESRAPETTEGRSIRLPQPAVCILEDQLILSDSLQALEDVIKFNSSGDGLLSDSIEFKLVQDRIKAQLKNSDMSILAYQRPEESMRLMYDLATDPQNMDNLEQFAQNNPFLTSLITAVRSKKLPPFEVIAKYLAPGGAFVVDEETGLHYTGFSMRRE
ncbi:MAG: hypothetical protein NTV29_15530 [Planctomycetota bacterium]|nr:hypothetical protein [Planctomycetota bacterium]